MRTDFSYSNTLGWNTFPVPLLTEKNRSDLNRSSENIPIARERHFPCTIADLYDATFMPDEPARGTSPKRRGSRKNLFGRLMKNDTDRLECLFALYRKAVA